MRERLLSPFLVVAVTACACGLLLLGARFALSPRIERNRELARGRLLLDAIGLHLSESEMQRVLKRDLREEKTPDGRVRRWVFAPGGETRALLYPMEGKGLWGPMRGVAAVTPDGTRIIGVRIFFQEETPGLGAEIEKPVFLKRLEGRTITREGEAEVRLRVVTAGTAQNEWEIDGITGATVTTKGFDLMLRAALQQAVADRQVKP